jgi:hypothetical protein
MSDTQITKIETESQFDDSPSGLALKWSTEMGAAEENQKKYVENGEVVVKRFLDMRSDMRGDGSTRVNLYTSNVQTLQALLYGKEPKVDVKRKFADPNDDIARVGGEVLQRLLNTDIERDSDTYATALENCLEDRLIPGMGIARVRYEAEFEEQDAVPPITAPHPTDPTQTIELAPGYTPDPIKTEEDVDTDYVHWRDFRWSPSRTWDEVRWVAFKAPMTRDALKYRFPEVGEDVPLNNQKEFSKEDNDGLKNDPWSRADVWEIWSKEDKKVYWWVKGFDKILDVKDDTLGLDGFFPCPRPLIANVTTTKFIPRNDFIIAQDLYDEVDMVSTRITLLERAVAVRGVYDQNSDPIRRLLSETLANELIPIPGFEAFKEKGGLAGVVDWLPLTDIVGALQVLRDYRSELMNLLYQVTGMSDIMRGQSTQGATATEQSLKAKFASVRVQRLQNDFARFASDIQSLKAEIISKHFDAKNIAERSNIKYMVGADQQLAEQAISLIKSDFYQYRIEVKPESVNMADMAAIKQERSEFLMAMSQFLQSSMPVAQSAPWAMPYLLQILQWTIAGFRGSATIEGVMDQMVLAANQALQKAAMQPPQPDPEMVKAQMEMRQMQAEGQMDMMGKAADLKFKGQAAMMDLAKKAAELKMKQHEMNLNAQGAAVDHAQKVQQASLDQEVSVKKMEGEIQRDAIKTATAQTGSKE